LTQVRFNYDGDLFFSASRGKTAASWFTADGRRFGTYEHNGAVYSLDVTRDSALLVTGAADNKVRMWDVRTGDELQEITYRSPVRWVEFGYGDKVLLVVTDAVMGEASGLFIYRIPDVVDKTKIDWQSRQRQINLSLKSKMVKACWGPLNQTIVVGSADGSVSQVEVETGIILNTIRDHSKTITDIQFDRTRSCFITSSTDHSARLYDARTMKLLKTYDAGRPVNAAAISPLMDHILLGGGESAETVTTTRQDSSQFKVRFFHKIFEDEIASIAGHFGPVNTISFTPNGRSYVSGGEDGYIRLHHFDDSYFTGLSDSALFAE